MAITLRQLNQGQEDEYEDDLSYSSLGGLTPEEAILQAQDPFAQRRRGGYRRPVDRGPLFNLGGVNQQGYRAERLDPSQRRSTGQLGMVDSRGQPLRQRPPQLQRQSRQGVQDRWNQGRENSQFGINIGDQIQDASPLMMLFMQWQRQLENDEIEERMRRSGYGGGLSGPEPRGASRAISAQPFGGGSTLRRY
jgi:hypothetical protein